MPNGKGHTITTLTQVIDQVSEAARMRSLDAETKRITQPLYAAEQMIAELRQQFSAYGDNRDGENEQDQEDANNIQAT